MEAGGDWAGVARERGEAGTEEALDGIWRTLSGGKGDGRNAVNLGRTAAVWLLGEEWDTVARMHKRMGATKGKGGTKGVWARRVCVCLCVCARARVSR